MNSINSSASYYPRPVTSGQLAARAASASAAVAASLAAPFTSANVLAVLGRPTPPAIDLAA
jgi:hypothetical protein